MTYRTARQRRQDELFAELATATRHAKTAFGMDNGIAADCAVSRVDAAIDMFKTSTALIAELGRDAAEEFGLDFDSEAITCRDHLNDALDPIIEQIALDDQSAIDPNKEHSTLNKTQQGTGKIK